MHKTKKSSRKRWYVEKDGHHTFESTWRRKIRASKGSGATADCLDDGGSVSASHIDTLPSVLNAETLSEDIREAQPAPDTLNAVDTDALPSTEPAENIIVESSTSDAALRYMRLLDGAQGITAMIDKVILKDINEKTFTLKQYAFVVVYVVQDILCCTCNPDRAKVATRLSSRIKTALTAEFGDCFHIGLVSRIWQPGSLPTINDHHYCSLETSNSYPILSQLSTPASVLVETDVRDYGVISSRGGTLVCGVCSTTCRHIAACRKSINDGCEATADLQWVLSQTSEVNVTFPTILTDNRVNLMKLMSDRCSTCGEAVESAVCSDKVIMLHSIENAKTVNTKLYKCCDKTYATEDISILGSYAIDNNILREYLQLFCTNALTLYGYYKNLCWTIFNQSQRTPQLQYGQLRYAWVSFLDKLSFDVDKTFRCDICQDHPPIVIGDGIALSHQRRYLRDLEEGMVDPTNIMNGLTHEQLVFISDAETRKLLREWVEGELSDVILQHLQQLVSTHRHELLPALVTSACPEECCWFVSQLCKTSSATALISPSSLNLIKRMYQPNVTLTADDEINLARESPFVFRVYSEGSHNIDWVKDCVMALSDHAQLLHAQIPHATTNAALVSPHEFFPYLPAVRDRGCYALDKKPGSSLCTKNTSSHNTLLPGIFTLHCPHSICIGYALMTRHESPNTPFSILRTRFPKAPSVVIYDNSCNLAMYALKRDPGSFKDTLFLIDRFHYRNHTGCSEGHNVSMYPQYKDLNTQVAEQSNSSIYRLRSMLCYTNQDNFHKFLKLFLAYRNCLARSRHGMPVQYPELFSMMVEKFKV